jgi:hypothetical protein
MSGLSVSVDAMVCVVVVYYSKTSEGEVRGRMWLGCLVGRSGRLFHGDARRLPCAFKLFQRGSLVGCF